LLRICRIAVNTVVHLVNALVLGNLLNIAIYRILPRTIVFGLHFCRRQYGSNFNHFNVAPKKRPCVGGSRSPITVVIESRYATSY